MKTDTNTYFFTVDEVAEVFSVENATVREWAKKGELSAKKVGKQWYFPRSKIFERQSTYDAIALLGGQDGFTKGYDLISGDDSRIEIKSSRLKIGKQIGRYWYFTNFHLAKMSDFYLLLGYDEKRIVLLIAIKIPSKELEKRLPKIITNSMKVKHNNNWDGVNFNINLRDKFFHQYIIFTNPTCSEWIKEKILY